MSVTRKSVGSESVSGRRVLIAIPSWNGRELLATCLQAVHALEYPNYDISVVDNGSADGSAEYVKEAFPGVHVIENARNRGFAAATNQAIRESDAEFVATLNNDTQVSPGWLGALVEAMESDCAAGMCASKEVLANRPGVVDSAGMAVDRAGIAWGLRDSGAARAAGPRYREVFGPSAGAALYRRTMLDEIGLFDERFFAYLEDVDLAWRAQWAGWKCLYVPDAHVRHVHSATGGRDPEFKRRLLGRNKVWLVAKNYPWPQLAWYGLAIAAYDFLAMLYAVSLPGGRGAWQGRFEALGGIGEMFEKRRGLLRRVSAREMMAKLRPLEPPWRIPRRYAHLSSREAG
jgi:GT2 family glycosyltransferase